VVRATVVIVKFYCVVLWSLFWLQQQKVQCKGTVLFVEIIVVTATVDIVKRYSLVLGVYCGYSNSSYSAMLLSFVCRYLWLKQQLLYSNDSVFCVEIIVVKSNCRNSAMLLCCVWRLLRYSNRIYREMVICYVCSLL